MSTNKNYIFAAIGFVVGAVIFGSLSIATYAKVAGLESERDAFRSDADTLKKELATEKETQIKKGLLLHAMDVQVYYVIEELASTKGADSQIKKFVALGEMTNIFKEGVAKQRAKMIKDRVIGK